MIRSAPLKTNKILELFFYKNKKNKTTTDVSQILELFFYKKTKNKTTTDVSPFKEYKKIKTSLNKITNRNNAHFSSKQSSSYPVKISC